MQKELLAEYKTFLKDFRYESIQVVAYVCIVLILLGIGLDYGLYPDMQYMFASVRVGTSVLIYGIILLIRTTYWGKSRIQLLTFAWLLFPQVMICWMIGVTEGAHSIYWAGLNLAIFTAGIVVGFGFWQNIAFGSITFLLYIVACAFHPESFKLHGAFLVNSLLLWMAIAVSAVYTYFNERARFMLFRLKEELSNKNRQLEEVNKNLSEININERKHAEIALHESEEKYRGLFESAGDFAYGTDIEGIFTAVSDSMLKVTGYNRDELINSSIAKILTPDNLALARKMTREKLESNKTATRYELEITDKTGKQIPLELVSSLTYMNGVPIGVQGHGRDSSERKKVELALQESIRKLEEKELAKSRFLAAAGHDLRQPLAAANLFIDALKGIGISPQQKQIVDRLDQAMSNFNILLETLLNVSKLDAGVIRPEITSVNLTEIFSWLEDSFAHICSEKHLRFKLYFQMSKPLVVRTDSGLLKSVLMNLVSNAIKFTLKGGVLISARQRGDSILFQIWDTGIGIQKDEIDKIFDDFYQINNLHRDRTQGLGLGLSIAKRSLALFDGKISCRSHFGRGSAFEFYLPIENISSKKIHVSNTSELMELESIRQFVHGKRFVIVEDDAMVSEALATSITVMGGEVESYSDAEIALQQVNIKNADCYIVDYMLPGNLDGTNFLHRLHKMLHRPACAVMMSGDTSSYFVHKAAAFDWPVLHKPVNFAQLISQLREQYNKAA